MNFLGKLQSGYEQLWKYILRPSRTPYSEESLGQSLLTLKGREVIRKDFQLTNKRGYSFNCSLWLPLDLEDYSCVVYLHGNSSNRLEGTEYLRRLLINKIALCTFDFSGCGNAEGEYVSLGFHEQQDLEEVINHLQNYPKIKRIALWGRSMGAVTALLYLSKHKGVKAAVFDSPFKSLKSLVEDMAQKTSKIPKIVLSGGLKIISGTIQQKANFSIYDLNPMGIVSDLNIPAFFVVGIEDEIIPIEHTKDLFEAYGGDSKLIKMVKGKHNDSRPTQCVREVVRFLLQQFKKPGEASEIKQVGEQEKAEKKEEVSSDVAQSGESEEHTKKEGSILSKFFTVFNKDDSKKYKQSKQASVKQQMEAFKSKLVQNQSQPSVISSLDPAPPGPVQSIAKKLEEEELQDRMRHYTYCYL